MVSLPFPLKTLSRFYGFSYCLCTTLCTEKWRKGSWRKARWRGWTGEWQTLWQNGVLWVKVTHPGFWRPPYPGAKPIWKEFRFKSLEMVPTKQWTPMIASSWQEDKIWNSSDANRLHDCIAKTGFVHFAPPYIINGGTSRGTSMGTSV